jgi:peptide/nickel transport system substrate-binding protein
MNALRYILLIIVLLSLAACEVQGGVARPTASIPPAAVTEPTDAVAATEAPAATTVTANPAPVRDGSLRIGMRVDPGDLLPYHADSTDERATGPISELLFPAPLLTLSYAYTTTGVLERVPSVENGDVTINTVDVYLDSSGIITTTVTDVITQVQQIDVTYRWNRELRWSDGTPLTAADSVFAYELARQGDLGQEATSKLALLDRYEQVDAFTTRAVLKPDFTDPSYVTTFWTPLPQHVIAGVTPEALRTSEFALMPVGYGPYAVARRDQGNLRLERNPHYAGPEPEAEVVTFIFRDNPDLLRSSVVGGSLDAAALELPTPEQFATLNADASSGALQLGAVANPIWEHLDFNLDVPLLQNINVRRAIAHAINREALIDANLGGLTSVLDSWIVPDQWAAAPADQLTRYGYDPTRAQQLLDEAGIVDTDGDGVREANGAPVSFQLLTTEGSPLRLAMAEGIQADLQAVGIGVNVEQLPTVDLYSLEGPLFRRGFELALFAWIAGPDPRGWERWSCVSVPNEGNGFTGNNFSGWCFFEADQAIRTATTSLDQAERAQAYLRQQQLFTQELPVLPFFQRVDVTIFAPSITGFQPDPTAPFTWNIGAWRRQ